LAWLTLSALLIALNWLVYIYAIVEHRVLESSLGYFITPVVSLILARVFFSEKIHPLQVIAGFIAVLAIMWEVYSLGQLPWISVVLSMAFAFYGVVRKICPIDGVGGLTIETLILLPFTLMWIVWHANSYPGTLSFGSSFNMTALLISSGIITAVPLVLFAMSARRISLSVVGFIMYINPTMQFLIAIFVLDEPYETERMVTFGFIWFALILFMIGFHRLSKDKTSGN
jgi:chloramphenicol-sensitive protein RarD